MELTHCKQYTKIFQKKTDGWSNIHHRTTPLTQPAGHTHTTTTQWCFNRSTTETNHRSTHRLSYNNCVWEKASSVQNTDGDIKHAHLVCDVRMFADTLMHWLLCMCFCCSEYAAMPFHMIWRRCPSQWFYGFSDVPLDDLPPSQFWFNTWWPAWQLWLLRPPKPWQRPTGQCSSAGAMAFRRPAEQGQWLRRGGTMTRPRLRTVIVPFPAASNPACVVPHFLFWFSSPYA